jgi:hypothetical protein
MCLLNNDFRLHKLGYTTTPGDWARAVIELSDHKNDQNLDQLALFSDQEVR